MKHPIPDAALRYPFALALQYALDGRLWIQVDRKVRLPASAVLRLAERTRIDAATGCWEFEGYLRNGYGSISYRNAEIFAHRLAFAVFNRPLVDGEHALHRCDNRPCWRPEHLFAGSHLDNVADMVAKGRNAKPPVFRGLDNAKAWLTDAQCAEIRASMRPQRELAAAYGCSRSTIVRIRTGQTRRLAT